jgi:hypothetical protein
MDNPNQSLNAILAALDPHNNILLRTEFILQTQTILAMAYRETLQRIQVEKSLCIDHLKRKMHDTNELPLEIHFEHDDTIIQILHRSVSHYFYCIRSVNGWGFQRITPGPDHRAYHHEVRFSS